MNLEDNIISLRIKQLIINFLMEKKIFKIPIHLALGHESIACAIQSQDKNKYQLVSTHRNVHHNLVRDNNLDVALNEYLMSTKKKIRNLGCMNLDNQKNSLVYSSSILGNNFSIGAGLALSNKAKKHKKCVLICTGDGAIEEGVFYETALFASSHNLALCIVIENNDWSMSTLTNDRRYNINFKLFSKSLGINYINLNNNNVYDYKKIFNKIINSSIKGNTFIVNANLKTLGFWKLTNKDNPTGKFINYHHGYSPSVNLENGGIILKNSFDPIYVVKKHIGEKKYNYIFNKYLTNFANSQYLKKYELHRYLK